MSASHAFAGAGRLPQRQRRRLAHIVSWIAFGAAYAFTLVVAIL